MGIHFETQANVEDDIKRLESALDILKLEYNTGSSYISLCCPFAKYSIEHQGEDRKPSFVLWPGYGTCKCYSCGYKSSILEFLEYYARLTNNPADFEYIQYLTYANKKIDEDNVILDEEILSIFKESDEVVEYFNTRKPESIDVTDIPLKFLYHSEKKRVVLPIRNDYNGLVGAIGRSTEDSKVKTYNYFGVKTSKCLVGHEFTDADKIMVVEGVTDMANAYEKTIKTNNSFNIYATLTASLSHWQAIQLIDMCKPIFMAFDMDKAGRRGQYEALKLLDSLGATVIVNVSWTKVKDVGEMSLKQFSEVFS